MNALSATYRPEKSGFRPDIQALRAVAVVAVVIFHLRPSWLPGGYVGVDVFFVISGFLITAHLIREHEQSGGILLRRFYARRVRRLLPAALAVLAAALVATALLVPTSAREQNLREIFTSLFYVQNWTLALDSVDYLRSTTDPSLVQHFWTLSIEEQYYALWPVALIGTAAIARSVGARVRVVWALMLGVLFAVSLAVSIFLTAMSPAAAYFVTPTRLFQFAVGGALALGAARLSGLIDTRVKFRRVLAWVGLAGIVAATLLFDSTTPYPGAAALLPTLGAAALIMAAQPTDETWSPMIIGRARPVQFLGDISYSVYLWHWPLIVLYPLIAGHPAGLAGMLGLVVLTLVLATLSRRFIELPITDPRHRPRLALAAIGAATALVLAGSGIQWGTIQFDRQQEAARIEAIEASPCFGAMALDPSSNCSDISVAQLDTAFAATDYGDATIDDCGTGRRVASIGDAAECSFGDESSSKLVVLVGDSHAGHWLPALQRIGQDRDWHIVTLLRSSCPFTAAALTLDGVPQTACSEWRRLAQQRAIELAPDMIVVSSSTPSGYEFGGGDLGSDSTTQNGYEATLRAFAEEGLLTVAIRDTPYMETDVPSCLGRLTATLDTSRCDQPRSAVLDAHVDPLWDAAALVEGVSRVDLSNYLCTPSTCLSAAGGVVVYRDRQHLSATYSRSLATPLLEALAAQTIRVP